MKIQISQEKLQKIGKRVLVILPKIGIVLFVLIFIGLTYISIWPGEDLIAKQENNKKVSNLKINLSVKQFSELNKSIVPGVAAGTRNPFSN